MAHDDGERWDETYARSPQRARGAPSPFLVEHVALLAPGRTLDLACGAGRNARLLAARGHRVIAADLSRVALDSIGRGSGAIERVRVDLDRPGFARGAFDNVVAIDFLDRALFAAIHEWLRPGGVLLFDAFLVDQRALGHPRNPDFLLGRNELLERLRRYRILRYREGAVTEGGGLRYRAGAVAVRPGAEPKN